MWKQNTAQVIPLVVVIIIIISLCIGFDFLGGRMMLEHQLITHYCNFEIYGFFANLFLKYT